MKKTILSISALACCATLAVMPAIPAQAAPANQSACRAVSVERLMERVADLPELAGLQNGDCVTIGKSEHGGVAAWTGEFIYHPKGSVITLGEMYMRWQDGFVWIAYNEDDELVAHIDAPKPLELSGEAGVWALPNIGTWVLRDAGNGQYITLVDVFTYKSGEMGPTVIQD